MRTLSGVSSSIEKVAPLIAMGALTLISFFLLKSSPSPSSHPASAKQAEYDYYVNQFSSAQLNASGQLVSFVKGRHALHSLAKKNIHVQEFLFTSKNKTSIYLGRSELADLDDDGNSLIMRNSAVIDRTNLISASDGSMIRIKSNHLHITQYPERIASNTFTQIEQSNRRIFAQSMQYDSDQQKMRLVGDVKIKVEKK